MAEFISTFTTGFSPLVEKVLPQEIKGVKILNIYDGLVHYKFDGNSRLLENIIFFNNTFFVLKTAKGNGLNFKQLVNSVCGSKSYYLISKGSFRIRFVQENQFTSADKNLVKRAEEHVLKNSRLTVDRVNPATEVWYSIRREGFAFCGQLISKRKFTEKNLNKGELRPEVAYFMTVMAGRENIDGKTVIDPFSGYGSIPVQIIKNYNPAKLYVNDISKEQIDIIRQRKVLDRENVEITCGDAFRLVHAEDQAINTVITDPPWGYYEDIGDIVEFYKKMFKEFKRILADDGIMIILSARKEEFEKAAGQMNIQIADSLHTLVNGKKAGLFICKDKRDNR